MKKILTVFLCATMLFLSGCNDTDIIYYPWDIWNNFWNKVHHWEFEQDYTEVKAIKIIEYPNGISHECIVLKELDVAIANELFKDIEAIDMKKYGPNLWDINGVCILIIFNNDNYDIIAQREPEHFRYSSKHGDIVGDISWLKCDKEQFEALINKYLE